MVSDLAARKQQLAEYVRNALQRLARGEIAGSHLRGVVDTAVTRFAVLLRETFRHHLEKHQINYGLN